MLKFDEKQGRLTLPGLREWIRVQDGKIQGETGWSRWATVEEEAMFRALTARSARPSSGGSNPPSPKTEGEGTTPAPGDQP